MEQLKALLEQLKRDDLTLDSAVASLKAGTAAVIAEVQRLIDEENRPIDTTPKPAGVLLDVPHVHQLDNRWYRDCGCACIAMILTWRGHPTTVNEACELCGKRDHNNLLMWRMVAGMGKKGLRTQTMKQGLNGTRIKQELNEGKPLIVLLEYDDLPKRHRSPLGGSNHDFWHFVVVTGYDDEAGVFVVNDPLRRTGQSEWSQAGMLEAMNGDMNGAPRQGIVLQI